MLPKSLISRTLSLTFNISATECPIEIKFSVLDSADQGLQNHWLSQPRLHYLSLPDPVETIHVCLPIHHLLVLFFFFWCRWYPTWNHASAQVPPPLYNQGHQIIRLKSKKIIPSLFYTENFCELFIFAHSSSKGVYTKILPCRRHRQGIVSYSFLLS